jgi:hypothetical protein
MAGIELPEAATKGMLALGILGIEEGRGNGRRG